MSFSYHKEKSYPRLGRWVLINSLGEGATSTVYLAFDPKAKEYSALKVFKSSSSISQLEAKREAQIHASLKHRSILEVKEFHQSIDLVDIDGETRRVTAIALELAKGGDLLLLVQAVQKVSEKLARTYFRQLIDVLEYLHNNKIAHRDIKLENLTLDANFSLKLADFGCACPISTSLQKSEGTMKYFSPEMLKEKAHNAASADIFASAMVLFCLVCGRMPFTKADESDYLYSLIVKGKTDMFWKAHEKISAKKGEKLVLSPELKSLLNKMFDSDPLRRFSLEEIKKSAWYQISVYEPKEVSKLVQEMIN